MTSTAGFTRTEVKVLLAVGVVLTAGLTVYIRRARIEAVWAKCETNVKGIAVAQDNYREGCNYGPGRPEAFVRGTEWFCRSTESFRGTPLGDGHRRTDGSRAFIALAKGAFVPDMATFVCPADPFALVLDPEGSGLRSENSDFPSEDAGLWSPWRIRATGSTAAAGHTFYSYSMQAGSPNPGINVGPKMLPTLPLLADRNPWSQPLPTLARMDPTAGGYDNGNSWNHNREGQVVAFRDGSTARLTDARWLEMPLSNAVGAATGFDYIYGDDPMSAAPPSSPASAPPPYTGVGSDQPPRAAPWGCFLFD